MKSIQDIVNNSGYPLQIRLAEWIEETSQEHKWRVSVEEHRWVNIETRDEGFIDLILERKGFNIKLVVECKRILGSWTFLLPMAQLFDKSEARILSIDYRDFRFSWKNIRINPKSPEASFCVMETGGKKDSRTFEKLAGELLLSLEFFAIEDTNLTKSFIQKLDSTPDPMFYIPIIVTTANIQTLNFIPSKVDIKNGKVTESNVVPIEFIRFRKNLATIIDYEKQRMYNLREINQENDRTVFVVQAERFIKFLIKLGGNE